MSKIIEIARDLMAVLQPLTGDRANGVVTITATGSDVSIPLGSYAIPIINGQHRDDLAFKPDTGPEDDGSWTVTSVGTDVDFMSNIGGARHNLADGTVLVFDPPISGIASLVAKGAFADGANPTVLGGIQDMIMFEQLTSSDPNIDLSRSSIKGFPAVIITWQDTSFQGLIAPGKLRNKETYTISIITNRHESDHVRRLEGQIILNDISATLVDRKEVDGYAFSGPAGVELSKGGRENGKHKNYQRFYIYYLIVTVTSVLSQRDTRTYSDWELAVLDVEKPQSPALPDQGDFTIVDDNEVDMT